MIETSRLTPRRWLCRHHTQSAHSLPDHTSAEVNKNTGQGHQLGFTNHRFFGRSSENIEHPQKLTLIGDETTYLEPSKRGLISRSWDYNTHQCRATCGGKGISPFRSSRETWRILGGFSARRVTWIDQSWSANRPAKLIWKWIRWNPGNGKNTIKNTHMCIYIYK